MHILFTWNILAISQIIEDMNLTSEEREKLEENLMSHGLPDMIPLTVMNKDEAIKDL